MSILPEMVLFSFVVCLCVRDLSVVVFPPYLLSFSLSQHAVGASRSSCPLSEHFAFPSLSSLSQPLGAALLGTQVGGTFVHESLFSLQVTASMTLGFEDELS